MFLYGGMNLAGRQLRWLGKSSSASFQSIQNEKFQSKSVQIKRHINNFTKQEWKTHTEGEIGTTNWRLYFQTLAGKTISPWHDIPLVPSGYSAKDGIFNFIVEIPRGTTAKNEINTQLPHNPICQDLDKAGNPRFIKYSRLPWNYGAIPQTWEDPSVVFRGPGAKHDELWIGDNDPIDV